MVGFPAGVLDQKDVSNPNISIGDYTYYGDPDDSENFERNVLYHYPFVGDRLVIGRFCALARRVRFIMNGANPKLSGFSTYPFQSYGRGWENVMPDPGELPFKGDTIVGNDVWIGHEVLLMPGVRIGNGAIAASGSMVFGDVPAYTIVGGNPARPIESRFALEIAAAVEAIAWWDWPIEKITKHLAVIVSADIEALRASWAEVT